MLRNKCNRLTNTTAHICTYTTGNVCTNSTGDASPNSTIVCAPDTPTYADCKKHIHTSTAHRLQLLSTNKSRQRRRI